MDCACIQVMYQNARSYVWVNNLFSDKFDVQDGVHQGLVLSPLLFIIVLEALSQEFRTSFPWKLLHDDHLILLADTMDKLLSKLGNQKKHCLSFEEGTCRIQKTLSSSPGCVPLF